MFFLFYYVFPFLAEETIFVVEVELMGKGNQIRRRNLPKPPYYALSTRCVCVLVVIISLFIVN